MGTSPFSLDRFEHEREHMFYLQKEVLDIIEGEKSSYIYGSRGTGKTTLLYSLNWKERLGNKHLVEALKGKPFKKKLIGVYIRVPSFSINSIDKWLEGLEDDVRGKITSFYFEMIILEAMFGAVSELIASQVIEISPKNEYECCAKILDKYNGYFLALSKRQDITFPKMFVSFRTIREHLERAALKRQPIFEAIDLFPLGQIGRFCNEVSSIIAEYCSPTPLESRWLFKICLDETETLCNFNQKVINTLVRLAGGAVSFVVSFVRPIDDPTSTLVPNLTLQQADRHIINLDDVSEKKFIELVEGVSSVRIRHRTGRGDLRFEMDTIFGKLDINNLLLKIVKKAESAYAKKLLKDAELFTETSYYKDLKKRSEKGLRETDASDLSLPIYHTYLFQRLGISIPAQGTEKWRRRSQESREIRKKMVAAYLCICQDLNSANPIYAYKEMLVGLSCGCIRDFLLFVNEAFIESKKNLEDFLSSFLSIDNQDAAFKRASDKKFDSIISSSGVTSPGKINLLVDGLAQITSYIQTNGPDNIALRSSERGRFFLNTTMSSELKANEISELINEAAEAGFLKLFPSDKNEIYFQVHHSLAPRYKFSYRGAYYRTSLTVNDLQQIVLVNNPGARGKNIERIKKRLSGTEDSDQLNLLNLQ